MYLKPQNEYLLCKQVNCDADVQLNGICFHQEVIPEYEVIDVSFEASKKNFKTGDVILANSVPTKAKLGNDTFFLIHASNVVGKISRHV